MSQHHKVIVIGSGPAGFTAAIYASRANLEAVVFEGNQPGGQLTITTEVENYPGFPAGVQGPEMMELFRQQAHRFGAKSIYELVNKVDFTSRPFNLWTEDGNHYTCDAVIVSTGATARLLHTKGEDTYWGRGISACATCDGFFYRGKKIFVVGGGDTAMEEANYLTHFGESVTIIHRRQEFRASKIMVDRAKENPKINLLLDSVIDEYLGEDVGGFPSLTSIRVENVKSGEMTVHSADGVFIAIGHTPNTSIFKGILDMNEEGYILTHGKSTYTNVPGVFACGDCQDWIYRQAVTAAGSGCSAAIDAERWLQEH
ncbi:MAG: thioredoxin reductase [Ignavibacteria bacterium]|nr:thioredoxin reductase [Ignavibacteria bacterium]